MSITDEKPSIRQRLRALRDNIGIFEQQCFEEAYTDTGEAWEILKRIEAELSDILRKSEVNTIIGE